MTTNIEREFLIQSNLIESVGEEGFHDSISAWEWAKNKEHITLVEILTIHRFIMRVLHPRIGGKFRTCNVKVGSSVCPDWQLINERLPEIIKYINTKDIPDPESWSRKTHIIFEKLHPFEDGNGRVGRILLNWQRLKMGLPILVIKYTERHEYYKWFE